MSCTVLSQIRRRLVLVINEQYLLKHESKHNMWIIAMLCFSSELISYLVYEITTNGCASMHPFHKEWNRYEK